ncbi:site-specific integrase [Gluconacetobacter asukensis]|uniref:Site-specific integrase n=2 Tax=Gluconacetobacter asukensis TaxID=1017181 RepID=A0A7W4J173_9PROT|nr:site-specific integrase [Gluconacetobacter asukensis]
MALATQARWRAIFQAAINASAKVNGVVAPRISVVKQKTQEVAAWLTKAEQDRLLESYADHVRPIALVLCFQGLRSAEALRLDWKHVDFSRRSIFVAKSKSGRQRSVPMHPRVFDALREIWIACGRPSVGPVFLNRWGRPYTDTAEKKEGGNPITKAHRTACKRAGIVGFTPHSWRHHWASWMVMTGCDLVTLMRLGGWSSPAMVQRYAAVSADHMADAIRRLT